MFGKLPKTLVMSEPGALNYIHRLYNQGQFTWTEYERLIQSCTKLQFKPTRQTKTDRYVLYSQYLGTLLLKIQNPAHFQHKKEFWMAVKIRRW